MACAARYTASTPRVLSSAPHVCCLLSSLQSLTLASYQHQSSQTTPISIQPHASAHRPFSTTTSRLNWLSPRRGESSKSRKGRPRVPTGGSVRGTTLVWGDYGLRLRDHDRRISAAQLKIADETIKRRLRGMKYRLYHRVNAGIGVYTSGNDQRMGKGKGSFDYWAARVPVSRVLFELKGSVHEAVVRDAMRLAGNKLPGTYEFVRKGDPAVMGITKLSGGLTEEMLRRSRMPPTSKNDAPVPNVEATALRFPSTTPV